MNNEARNFWRANEMPSQATGLLSVVSAVLGFLSRPCCSIPFFMSMLGAGSSGLVLALLPYRTVFLIIGMIFFGISSYLVFRVHGALFNKIFFIISFSTSLLFILSPHL